MAGYIIPDWLWEYKNWDTRSVKRCGFLRKFPVVIVSFIARDLRIRLFVLENRAHRKSVYELSITVTRDHCERKVQVPRNIRIYEREESRNCAEVLLDNSRTYNYVNNELMCYRLNEKRNIQARPSESQLISSPLPLHSFPPPPCLIVASCLPYLTSIRLSHRLVVINGRVINASVTVTSHG